MKHDENINIQIEQAVLSGPWGGVITKEEAAENAKQYRAGLNAEERCLFDDLIQQGRHPYAAIQAIEIYSGREKPHGQARDCKAVPAKVA